MGCWGRTLLPACRANGHGLGWPRDIPCPLWLGECTRDNRVLWEGHAGVVSGRHCPPPVHDETHGPPYPTPTFPGNRNLGVLSATAQAPDCELGSLLQCGYLDGLSCARPLLGTASGHVQEEGLEPAWQGQLVVSGDAELGCCPQDCSHTVHGGLGGEKCSPVQQHLPTRAPPRAPRALAGEPLLSGAPLRTSLELGGPSQTPGQIPQGPGLGTCMFTNIHRSSHSSVNGHDLRPQRGPSHF